MDCKSSIPSSNLGAAFLRLKPPLSLLLDGGFTIDPHLVETTSRIHPDRAGTIPLTVPIGIESKIHLEFGFKIEWEIKGDRLILTPEIPKRLSIQELIAPITPENRHDPIRPGSPVGNKIGYTLCWRTRKITFIAKAPNEILTNIRLKIKSLIFEKPQERR